jgi:hypothetical protein
VPISTTYFFAYKYIFSNSIYVVGLLKNAVREHFLPFMNIIWQQASSDSSFVKRRCGTEFALRHYSL